MARFENQDQGIRILEGHSVSNGSNEDLGKTKPLGTDDRTVRTDNHQSAPPVNIDEEQSGTGITLEYFVPRTPNAVERSLPDSPLGSRYSRIREHAKGGLGLVFLAQDHELQREVALKEIQPQFVNNQASNTRFLLEARLTGRLEHPGIVPVYGLGHYPDGRPFYAMRFIQGASLQEEIESFHRKNSIKNSRMFDSRDFRGLIRRFIDVCNAIHYAHEKGVIHRDIKPANVMLGNYGETLVVDWGLAKFLQSDAQLLTDEHAGSPIYPNQPSSTLDGDVIGTPLYMSPEQATGNNRELTAASDIYSLGATLFTLATGAKPVEGRSRFDLLENVRKGRILHVRDKALRAPKAIDAICRKAMALEPVNRYPSAKLLAEDLDRWMADDAVQALKGSESWLDLSGRLMRRYRNWTVSVGAALLLITFMSVLAAFIVNDARRKERLAKNEASDYRQDALERYRMSRDAIDSWLVNSSEALTYFPATQSIRKELLTRAAKDYATLSESSSADPELRLESIRATGRLGDIEMDQEDYAKAHTSYEKALDALRVEPQVVPDTTDLLSRWRVESARTRCQLGVLSSSELQFEESAGYFAEAVRDLEKLLAENPRDAFVEQVMATTLNHHAAMLVADERYNEALPLNEKALAILGESSTNDEHKSLALARTRISLGRILAKLGRFGESSATHSSAIEQLKVLTNMAPDHPAYLNALADAFISRAVTEQASGNSAAQLEDLQNAREFYAQLKLTQPDIPRYAEAHAITVTDIGLVQVHAEKVSESLSSLLAARQELTNLVKDYPLVPSFRFHLAAVFDGLSQVYFEQATNLEAIESGSIAYRLYEELAQGANKSDRVDIAKNIERAAVVLSHVARARAAMGESETALIEFEKARAYLEQLSNESPNIPDYRNELAYVLFYMGVTELEHYGTKAEAHFAAALLLWKELTEQSKAAEYASQLAWFHLNCPIAEIANIQTALDEATKTTRLAPDNPRFLVSLAEAQILAGLNDESKKTLDRLRMLGFESSASYLCVSARICLEDQDKEGAKLAMKAAKQWAESNSPGNFELKRKLAKLAEVLE